MSNQIHSSPHRALDCQFWLKFQEFAQRAHILSGTPCPHRSDLSSSVLTGDRARGPCIISGPGLNLSANADDLKEPSLSTLRHALLTVPEAAWVTGLSQRAVQHEIDEKVIPAEARAGRRGIAGMDLIYLSAIRDHYALIAPALRKQVRNAIIVSVGQHRATAKVEPFSVSLPAIEARVRAGFEKLEQLKRDFVESRADVLGGEPVLKGTRLSIRYVAGLVSQGATPEELAEDFELTAEQVEAAVVLAKVNPRRGRPLKRPA